MSTHTADPVWPPRTPPFSGLKLWLPLLAEMLHLFVLSGVPPHGPFHVTDCPFHETATSPKVMSAPWRQPTFVDSPSFQVRTTLKISHNSWAPPGEASLLSLPSLTPPCLTGMHPKGSPQTRPVHKSQCPRNLSCHNLLHTTHCSKNLHILFQRILPMTPGRRYFYHLQFTDEKREGQ